MKKIKYLFYSILIVILFFGCLEIALRMTNIGNPDENFDSMLGFGDTNYFTTDWRDSNKVRTSAKVWAFMKDVIFNKSPDNKEFRVMMYGESNVHYLNESLFENTFNDDRQLSKFGHFRFINFGCCGCGSKRIKKILDQSIIYRPSLLFIYMGNNEFIDLKIKESVLEYNKNLPWLRKLLSKTYTYNFFKSTYRSILKPKLEQYQYEEGNNTFFLTPNQTYKRHLAGYVELRDLVYQNFKQHLIHMIRKAKEKNIKVIISTVPSNDTVPAYCPFYPEYLSKDQVNTIKKIETQADNMIRPLLSFLNVTEDPYTNSQLGLYKGMESYTRIFKESLKGCGYSFDKIKPLNISSELKSKLIKSANLYEQALNVSNEVPQIHYKLGLVYYLLENFSKARYHFRQSSTLDAAPLRSSPTANKIIREVAKQENIPLIDFDEYLCPQGYQGICDWRLFTDYVHLTDNAKILLMNKLKEKFKETYLHPQLTNMNKK